MEATTTTTTKIKYKFKSDEKKKQPRKHNKTKQKQQWQGQRHAKSENKNKCTLPLRYLIRMFPPAEQKKKSTKPNKHGMKGRRIGFSFRTYSWSQTMHRLVLPQNSLLLLEQDYALPDRRSETILRVIADDRRTYIEPRSVSVWSGHTTPLSLGRLLCFPGWRGRRKKQKLTN